ncbi:hypothetical protein [Limnohabitans sp.]|uniref:hypothetical protein n=1 Tax=Limnohabitans sp. TaxID=1907725 RepID=UPI0031FDDEA5
MQKNKKQTFGNKRYGIADVLAQGNLYAETCTDADMRDVLGVDVLMYCFGASYAGNGGQIAEAVRSELKHVHNIDADKLCAFELMATFVARDDKEYAKQIYEQMLQVTEAMAAK